MNAALRIAGLSLVCAVVSAVRSTGQTVKLSGEMVQPVGGAIHEGFLVTADGQRVVYCAEQDLDDVVELYSVPLDGGSAPVKLNGPVSFGGVSASEVTLSPDSRWVLFMAQEEYLVQHAYSVLADGSEPAIDLALPTAMHGGPRSFCRATPDGARVVYCRDEEALYGAAIDGSGSVVLLSGAATQVSWNFAFDAGGARVLYLADRDVPGVLELYSTPVDGNGSTTRLSGALGPGGSVRDFARTPDGSRVVYLADQEADDVFELFAAPVDGSSAPVALSGSLVTGGDVQLSLRITSDSARVVYRADAVTDEVIECFSVPIDGSRPPTRLVSRLVAGGDVSEIWITPDDRSVVYLADQEKDGVQELYRVPIDVRRLLQVPPARLNPPLVAGGDVVAVRIGPDGTLAYRADQEADDVFEVYVVAPGGARALKLNGALVAGGDVAWHEFTQDGARVLYLADDQTDRALELFSAPADASATAVRLNAPLPRDGAVGSFVSAGDQVVFTAPRDPGTINAGPALQVVPSAGGAEPKVLTPELALGPVAGDVFSFQTSPDGRWAVYVADQEEDAVDEIYAVRTFGRSPPVKLNPRLVAGGDVRYLLSDITSPPADSYRITPDGARVVYCADQELDERVEMYVVPIDGGAPPAKVSPSLSTEEGVLNGLRVSPDSARVAFRVLRREASTEWIELWAAALVGAPSPVLLHSSQAWNVHSLDVTATGTRVVYLARQSNEIWDGKLWSCPIDGSDSPVLLTRLDIRFSVSSFALEPTGVRAVFLGDQVTDEATELYSVPVDGSASPTRLSDPMFADRDVSSFSIAPDGTRVTYLSDQGFNERWELFSVPSDASLAPVRLNDPLVGAGHVGYPGRQTYFIDSRSSRVVYLVFDGVANRYELFSAPIDGNARPVQLSGPLVAGGNVGANPTFFALTPDGRTVVYVADQEIDGEVELYAVPIDGSRAAFKLSQRVQGEVVRWFSIDPRGFRVLYSTGPALGSDRHWFEVPIEQGAAPRELHASRDQAFTPDARWVLHRSNLEPGVQLFELFATLLSPRKVSGAPTPASPR
ncbi:MAG TPA: hypothetical protein VF530_08865 [Planctomycetota bacterium]